MKLFVTIISLLITAAIPLSLSAQEKPYSIGVMIGLFMPQDWQIQGTQIITYDSLGNASSASVSGFGNGFDLVVYGTYYFTDWGIRLETGPRLLHKHKLDIEIFGIRRYYENRLNIIPVTLTVFHKIPLPDTRITPYIGIGSGIYFSSWERKHYIYYPDPQPFERTWDKGSKNPFGIHFLAGLDFPVYYNLYFSGELKYSYVSDDWEINDVDSDAKTKYDNLNIGGTSLRFGLNYKF